MGSKIERISDCELETIIKFVDIVNKKIKSNHYSSIINIDETGIYYDSKIDFTLEKKV